MTLIPDPELTFPEGVELLAAALSMQKMSAVWAADAVLSDGADKMQTALAECNIENPGTAEEHQEQLDLLKSLREEDDE